MTRFILITIFALSMLNTVVFDGIALSQEIPLCKTATDLVADGNFALAAEKLEGIKAALDLNRFANFPDCSIQLLNLSRQEPSPERKVFLSNWAYKLSPISPQLALADLNIAMNNLDVVMFFQNLLSLCSKLSHSPLLMIEAFVLVCLLVIILATLWLFLTLFSLLLQKLEYLISKRRYIIFGSAIAAICLGIHLTIAIWGLAVQSLYPRKRAVLLCCGTLLLMTFFMIPIALTIRAGTSEKVEQQLEALWIGDYFEDRESLAAKLNFYSDDLAKLSIANLQIEKGDYLGARAILERLINHLPQTETLTEDRVAKLLLGKALLGANLPREAKTHLQEAEALGERSYMLYDALAQASIQLTEINEHEKYFYTANSYSNKTFNYLRVKSIANLSFALKRMLHPTYLRAKFDPNVDRGRSFENRINSIFKHLLFSHLLFGILSGLTLLGGAFYYSSGKGAFRYAHR
jgi:hypothetical protein